MRASSVTLGLGVLVFVAVLLCSTVDGMSPVVNIARSRRYVDEVHAKGLEATERALGKRQAWRNGEKAAERVARKNEQMNSDTKLAEKWRKRDGGLHDDIIGFF